MVPYYAVNLRSIDRISARLGFQPPLCDDSKIPTAKIAVFQYSDIFVAEEAQVAAEVMGNQVEAIFDFGVAGIHRLMNARDRLFQVRVVVLCAGMDGVLPSVMGGPVSALAIAVPTTVGHVASLINRL